VGVGGDNALAILVSTAAGTTGTFNSSSAKSPKKGTALCSLSSMDVGVSGWIAGIDG
jgi:hypothetical protein